MSWAAALGPWSTGPAVDLPLNGLSVTWKRSDSSSASFSLTNTMQAFGQVVPLQTDLWVWRNGTVVFRGRCGGHDGTLSPRSASRSHTAADYREVLKRRRTAGPHLTWTSGTDPADAAWQMVVDEQDRTGSDLGIVRGTTVKSGPSASAFNVEGSKWLRDNIDTLAKLTPAGADWDVVPTSEMGLAFAWWAPTRGADDGVVVDLGGVAISAGDNADTSGYGNGGEWTGQQPSGGGTAPSPVRTDVSGLGSRPEGRWDVVESTELTTAGALSKYAANRLTDVQVTPISWTAELQRGWWQGPNHLFVADPFEWVCRIPILDPKTGQPTGAWAYNVDETQVVDEITATFDDAPEPRISLKFGAPLRDERFYQRSTDQRLRALERR